MLIFNNNWKRGKNVVRPLLTNKYININYPSQLGLDSGITTENLLDLAASCNKINSTNLE